MIKIDLKGQVKEFESGVTPADVAKSIGMGLYKSACAARIDGQVCDLRTPITQDCALEILTFDTEEGKHAYWHTTSHILAQAVLRLYPGTKFSIGPAIDNGFYYDFDLENPLSADDLPKIEEEMKRIIKENLPLERFELPVPEAKALMEGQPYKEELIDEHAGKGENISFYKQGDFTDLCAGPHLLSTGSVKAVKLTAITGAYWRGDAKNKMLTRVYGISFPKQSLLDEHLHMLEAVSYTHLAENDGGGDLHIAVLLVDLAPVVDQGVFQHHALGQKEGEAGAFVPQHKHQFADIVMVL